MFEGVGGDGLVPVSSGNSRGASPQPENASTSAAAAGTGAAAGGTAAASTSYDTDRVHVGDAVTVAYRCALYCCWLDS